YASQWFLTLYTAKFPLFMVFHILDLFLSEGMVVLFSMALSLLKASQRDLLALDFEGVLKYFRVNLPKKHRNEHNFKELLQIWMSLHSKISEKKLKKLEKKYQLVKEAQALREEPSIRFEREFKRLSQLIRRLEQENDDLASEYIEAKISLSKQLEELRDDYEIVKAELLRYKTDYQNNLNEVSDTNKKLKIELDQIKQLWRIDNQKFEDQIQQANQLSLEQTQKHQSEMQRNTRIIQEYKQICNSLSGKVEKWQNFKKKSKAKKLSACQNDLDNSWQVNSSATNLVSNGSNSSSSSADYSEMEESETRFDLADSSLVSADNGQLTDQELKIKNLELELARVKLELVDAQCKNQEFDHRLKTMVGSNPESRHGSITTKSLGSTTDNLEMMTASTTSINSLPGNGTNNSWLSKTLTQFKEATSQVVQKAQKSKLNG
ncbi:rab GTPase-activating 1 isoform X2, partial [Brachionus plicatilis]